MVNRRYHFHTPGVIYIFITILIAIGAFNSQNNLLFAAFGFALALLIVSGIISGSMLMGISAERLPVATGAVGEPLMIRYRIRNRNRWLPAFALTIEEIDPTLTRRGKSESDESWSVHLPEPRAFAPHVKPNGVAEVDAAVAPHHRGLATLHAFRIGTTFPFGLIRKSVNIEQQSTVLVRPRFVETDLLTDQQAAAGTTGDAVSRIVGADNEFFALREYVPGDPQRTIAWAPSARRDTLLVRQHVKPGADRTWILLQLDASDDPDVTERSISIAASIINESIARSTETGLHVPAVGLMTTPRTGSRHRDELLDALAMLEVPEDARPHTSATPPGDLIEIAHADARRRREHAGGAA